MNVCAGRHASRQVSTVSQLMYIHILSNCFPCQQICMYRALTVESHTPYKGMHMRHESQSFLRKYISSMDVVLYSATLVLGGLIGFFKAGIV
jgi:TPP-dependent 2-oxoacid decarboxylase